MMELYYGSSCHSVFISDDKILNDGVFVTCYYKDFHEKNLMMDSTAYRGLLNTQVVCPKNGLSYDVRTKTIYKTRCMSYFRNGRVSNVNDKNAKQTYFFTKSLVETMNMTGKDNFISAVLPSTNEHPNRSWISGGDTGIIFDVSNKLPDLRVIMDQCHNHSKMYPFCECSCYIGCRGTEADLCIYMCTSLKCVADINMVPQFEEFLNVYDDILRFVFSSFTLMPLCLHLKSCECLKLLLDEFCCIRWDDYCNHHLLVRRKSDGKEGYCDFLKMY